MSDKQLYTACWYPSEQTAEENGARRVAYSFYAANEKQARAKATLHFMEQFPDADDAEFELKIYVVQEGIPSPEVETWDEGFLYEKNWNDELGYPESKSDNSLVDFSKLSEPLRIDVLVKYHTTEITNEQLSGALEAPEDAASNFDSHIADAIKKTPAVAKMYPERILDAIDYIREKCPPTKKWPEIKAVLAGWLNKRNDERKEEASTSGLQTVSAQQNATDETLRVPSGATAGGGNLTDRGEGFKHDFDSLALEIALGRIARSMDFDIYNLRSAHINRAREMIKLKERPFPALFSAYRNMPGVLDYSRAIIIYSVKTAPDNIEATPGKLTEYLNKTLTETDHANPDPHIVAVACGITGENYNNEETEQNSASATCALADEQAAISTVGAQQPDANTAPENLEDGSPVERTGPFYYRTSEGQVGRANKLAKLDLVLAQGCEEITKEEYQSLKDNPPAQRQSKDEQQLAKNDRNGLYSVEELTGEQQQTQGAASSNKGEKKEVLPAQPEPPVFQSIAADLENDLAEKGDNLKIWRSVMRTDPRYTKDLTGAGFEGTSINAEYMIMRATEIFGPIGSGWGYEVLEDRMIPGAPMSEAIYEGQKFIGKRMLRDADGTLITELNHSIKIRLWYLNGTKERCVVEAYGATQYMYMTSKNIIKCDGEAQKKSLTDAIKKSLSLLGFSADVWLGLYDQAEYKQENAIRFDLINASDKAEDVTLIRKELDEKFKANTKSMREAVTPNEISGIASSLTRVMGIHLKDARERGDAEYAKYIEGRLRRLEEVKSECLTKLQEKAA